MSEEQKFAFGTEKSPEDNRDYIVESIIPQSVAFPATLDLRDKLPKVKDQGSQGSCSAMTASTIKEYHEHVDVRFTGEMSPQFIYNLRYNQDSEGMSPRDTMKILQRIGAVPEYRYQYGTQESATKLMKNEELQKVASNYQIDEYSKVQTIDGLKQALYKNGVCYVAFPVYNYGKEFWKKDSDDDQIQGGHAVAICGYTSEGFIIRNSWGTDWGNEGYTLYKYSDFGLHWEIWTAIDENSREDNDPWYTKLWYKFSNWYVFNKQVFWMLTGFGTFAIGTFILSLNQ